MNAEYISRQGTDLSVSFDHLVPPVKEAVDSDRKTKILEPAIAKVRDFLAPYGVDVPSNLASRVFIIHDKDYKKATGRDHIDPTVDFEKGLAYVPYEYFLPVSLGENHLNQNIRSSSTHEMLHILTYQEQWMYIGENKNQNFNPLKRHGIQIDWPDSQLFSSATKSEGGRAFTEGVTETIAMQLMNEAKSYIYIGEREVVKEIVDRIGIDPLIKAMFTKDGLMELNLAMNDAFGRNSLDGVLQLMGLRTPYNKLINYDPRTWGAFYPEALKFLKLSAEDPRKARKYLETIRGSVYKKIVDASTIDSL